MCCRGIARLASTLGCTACLPFTSAQARSFGALAQPAADRDAFVVAACEEDQELLSEVSSLLLFHEADETGASSPAPEELFSAGDMFADRYRMITCIGRGGMARCGGQTM